MSAEKVGRVFGAIGSFSATVGTIVGGEPGAVLAGAALVAKGIADVIARGHSVQSILTQFALMPDVKLKWTPNELEDTRPATPSALADAKKGDG